MEKNSVDPKDFKLIHEKECWDVGDLKKTIELLYELRFQFSVTPFIYWNEHTGFNSTRYRVMIYAYNE